MPERPAAESVATERDRPGPRWQLAVLLLVAGLLLLSAFPYFEQTRNANELPRLVQSIAVVEAGEWALDGERTRGISVGPDIARSPVDGRLYPNKPPGTTVVGTLAYRVARVGDSTTLREFTWWARLFAGVIPALVIVLVGWGRLREFGHGGAITACVLLTWLFGTPMFAYARLFYGHALAACLLYLGMVALNRGHERNSVWRFAAGGFAAALAITVEYGVAFAGLPIAGVLLARLWTDERRSAAKQAGVALLAALVPVILLALYHRSVFGSMLATGYHHAADPVFAEAHGHGLLGLGWPRLDKIGIDLFSPKTGLLIFSPVVALAIAGLVHAARRTGPRAHAARLDLAVIGVMLVVGLGLGFEGGWRIGPRYLVVVFPCLLLGLAEAIEAWRERPVIAGIWAGLTTWSVIACSLAATMWPHVDPTHIGTPFGEVFLPLLRDGRGPYGLPELFSAGSMVAIALPVLVTLSAVGWVVGKRTLAVMLPMLFGAIMGLVVVLLILPRSAVKPAKSERNLRYIEMVYEPKMEVVDGVRQVGSGRSLELEF